MTCSVDEFHIGGREATVHLAEKIDLKADVTVLDIGSGIGGPAFWSTPTGG
jgi:cyclopropane fatty-acyl-phospholipid synthase-like methyltransferase